MSTEKPIKRFSLGEDRTSFAMSDLNQTRDEKLPFSAAETERSRPEPSIRDKDNAAPKPKPQAHAPHPRLAPPGSSGIRPSIGPIAERAPPPLRKACPALGQQGHASRSFQPLVQTLPAKGATPER